VVFSNPFPSYGIVERESQSDVSFFHEDTSVGTSRQERGIDLLCLPGRVVLVYSKEEVKWVRTYTLVTSSISSSA
jgi:hypothetical protein